MKERTYLNQLQVPTTVGVIVHVLGERDNDITLSQRACVHLGISDKPSHLHTQTFAKHLLPTLFLLLAHLVNRAEIQHLCLRLARSQSKHGQLANDALSTSATSGQEDVVVGFIGGLEHLGLDGIKLSQCGLKEGFEVRVVQGGERERLKV